MSVEEDLDIQGRHHVDEGTGNVLLYELERPLHTLVVFIGVILRLKLYS